jgi:hypothetical protein
LVALEANQPDFAGTQVVVAGADLQAIAGRDATVRAAQTEDGPHGQARLSA